MSEVKDNCLLYYLSSTSDPTNVRYIGITSNTAKVRLLKHISDARYHSKKNTSFTKKDAWILAELSYNNKIIITIIADMRSFEEVKQMEIAYIKEAKQVGFNLVNTSEGGEGYKGKKTDEHIRKIAAAQKGKRKMSDANRALMSKLHKGRILTPQHREKVLAALRRTPYTDERRRKIGDKSRGRKHSEDTKKILSIKSKGRVKQQEEIDKWVEKNGKKTVQIDRITGEILNVYRSARDAGRICNISPSSISYVCNGIRKTAGQFKWEYLNTEKHKLKNGKIIFKRNIGQG